MSSPEQTSFELRSRDQMKQDLRAKVLSHRKTGDYSLDYLSPQEKELYAELAEEDRQGDGPNYDGRGIRTKKNGNK